MIEFLDRFDQLAESVNPPYALPKFRAEKSDRDEE